MSVGTNLLNGQPPSKFGLLFYSPTTGATPVEGKDESPFVSSDDIAAIKAFAKSNGEKNVSVLVRAAEAFNGEIETIAGKLPVGVFLLGDGPAIRRVGEAYEEAGVEITQRDFDVIHDVSETSGNDADDRFGGDLDRLKAHATELGINFGRGIGYNALMGRVEAKEAENKEAAA